MAHQALKERPVKGKSEPKVNQEDLQMAAYYHWLNRGCPVNDDLTDWMEMEKEMKTASK